MKKRSAQELRRAINQLQTRIDQGEEAAAMLEEAEFELAQDTASLFVIVSSRFEPDDAKTSEQSWEYELIGVSEEIEFGKFDFRFSVDRNEVCIRVYDLDETILYTLRVPANERVKLSTLNIDPVGEMHYVINVFRTRIEAATALNILISRQSNPDSTCVN